MRRDGFGSRSTQRLVRGMPTLNVRPNDQHADQRIGSRSPAIHTLCNRQQADFDAHLLSHSALTFTGCMFSIVIRKATNQFSTVYKSRQR